MKTTELFKQQIKAHLDGMAADDAVFAGKYANANKTLDECVNYILNEVYKSGKNGYSDEEVFGMAVHYYDEENIKVEKNVKAENVRIVSNYNTTEEDVAEAKAAALKRLENEAYEKIKGKLQVKKPVGTFVEPTLF